ncbi:TIGR04351 family putative TOMM peptide [Streptomyces sp. NPDC018964]|uniref:TIGR04351 family putative TOMM peptide n=1 Tax=Streptomyces sp. NPDC018964 TaxID=3365058 RepID=UPI0037B0E8A3
MYEGIFPVPQITPGADGVMEAGLQAGEEARFVELVACAWLDPELASRYRADARAVLAEFGVTLTPGQEPPALPENPMEELSIEELSRPAPLAHAAGCLCWAADDPAPEQALTTAGDRAVAR